MNFYVGLCFDKDVRDAVFKTLEQFDYPIASFVSSREEYACIKEAECHNCGHLVTDLTAPDEDCKEMYCFVEAEKDVCKELWSIFVDLEGVQLAFLSESLDALFEKYMQPLCTYCKKVLTNTEEAEPPKKRKLDFADIMSNVHRNGTVPAQSLRVLLEAEGDPFAPASNISEGTPDPNSTVHFQGDFNSLRSCNPEYQWTKCKLCMRILRTKRCDASRMRTLQASHARNHVSRFQYACKLCSFGCRFHGGIQLHMTRMHPGQEAYFVDRSKDARYREEMANMVVTCFGPEVKAAKGNRSEMYSIM